jgi:hypothetical protein
MAAPAAFIPPLLLLRDNPEAVLAALRQGWVDSMETGGDELTDLHVLSALQSGLLGECAAAFPDPRLHPEIPAAVLLTASVAGAFQGEYALRESGCALHSPALLAELGLNAAWLAAGEGLSRRGTAQAAVFHGDVLRKLLLQIAAADREAGRMPGASLLTWWNTTVGPAFLRHAGGGSGAWIRDATKLVVRLDNDRYEGSEVVQEDGEEPQRGYKLGLLSSLIDTGRLLVGVSFAGISTGDLPLTTPLVRGEGTPLAAGDSLREDRGLLDGAEITVLKRDLGVDVIFPLKKKMLAYRLAVARVEASPYGWKRHPNPRRHQQEFQKVADIGGPWEECQVRLDGVVVREWHAKKQLFEYWVFASTEKGRSAKGILRDYEARSECEEDHRQVKGPDWELDEFQSTRLVEIVYHVLMVLFAYNLCQLYGQTAAGQRFAGQTKRARQRALRRQRRLQVVVVAGPYYAVFDWSVVAEVLLAVEGAAKERLRAVVQRQAARGTAVG